MSERVSVVATVVIDDAIESEVKLAVKAAREGEARGEQRSYAVAEESLISWLDARGSSELTLKAALTSFWKRVAT